MGWGALCRDPGAGALVALQNNNFTGFETQGAEEALSTTNTPTYPTTDPRTGQAHLSLDAGDVYELPWIETGKTDQGNDYIVTFAIKVGDKTPTVLNRMVGVKDSAGAILFDLRVATNGDVELRDNVSGLIRTLTDPLSTTVYQLWQIYFQHSATGTIEIFIDGISQGQDTN